MLATRSKGKVLIIDDEPGVRDLLSETLSEVGGYETVIATDGLDGIEKMRTSEFDVIFTDLAMPRLNGIDFLKKCKEINTRTPIVVLTGLSSMEIAVNAMRHGAYDFITKPFRLDKIVSTTEKIFGEKKLLGRLVSSQGSEASLRALNAELFKRLQEIVALHSIRPYRRARTHEFAIGELRRCSGTQFDPEVVRVFLETTTRGEISA